MASENLEDNKPEDEAPSQDTPQIPDEAEPITADCAPQADQTKEDNKVDAEIQQPAEEQGADANHQPEDQNVHTKAQYSAEEEEVEQDNEVESEGTDEPNKDVKASGKSRKTSAEKKGRRDSSLKEPITPTIDRPARERKTVERYSVPSPGRLGRSSASKVLSIEKGRGTSLRDIPNVAFKLSKRKADDNLQLLHTILFGKKAKAQTLKRNISQFSGYVWIENEEKQRSKAKEKLEKCVKEKLVDFCDVLNIPINKGSVKKEELSVKLLEFLESPHATTDVLLADKEQKGKKRRRASSGKIVGSGESAEVPAKAKKQKSQPTKKRKHTSDVKEEEAVKEEEDEDKVETSNDKDGSHDKDDDADDVTESKEEIDEKDRSDEDEKTPEKISIPKKSSKKAEKDDSGSKSVEKASATKKAAVKSAKVAAKSTNKSSNSSSSKADTVKSADSPSKTKGVSKKQKVEVEEKKPVKEKSSGKKQTSKAPAKVLVEEQGKGKGRKKIKKEPSREEMHEVVVNILKQVDFNTATLSDILRQLGTHFGVDLMHRKAEVKDIITDVINNMSDEEEEADDDGGNDTDKDEDKDEDD